MIGRSRRGGGEGFILQSSLFTLTPYTPDHIPITIQLRRNEEGGREEGRAESFINEKNILGSNVFSFALKPYTQVIKRSRIARSGSD